MLLQFYAGVIPWLHWQKNWSNTGVNQGLKSFFNLFYFYTILNPKVWIISHKECHITNIIKIHRHDLRVQLCNHYITMSHAVSRNQCNNFVMLNGIIKSRCRRNFSKPSKRKQIINSSWTWNYFISLRNSQTATDRWKTDTILFLPDK